MRALYPLLFVVATMACPAPQPVTSGPSAQATAASVDTPAARGEPLEFVLDPVDRDYDHTPESQALRGKRAVVLVMATYDVGSLLALRTLAPLLNDLPKDAACLQVALQPVSDRELIGPFMDAEKTPCRRAIGDAKRGRLGDLANVKVIPTVLVLRADGTLAGGIRGTFNLDDVRALLDRAK